AMCGTGKSGAGRDYGETRERAGNHPGPGFWHRHQDFLWSIRAPSFPQGVGRHSRRARPISESRVGLGLFIAAKINPLLWNGLLTGPHPPTVRLREPVDSLTG